MTTATIYGNACGDPMLRFTPSGMAVCAVTLACERSRKVDGEWTKETSFIDVTCWGSLAENVAESIQKGVRVIAAGRLQQESWEDKETGAKRSKIVLVADEVGPSLKWATAQVVKVERES